MAIVKGQNLRVFIGSRAIAAALECSLQVQLATRQRSTKDDDSDFVGNVVASLNWSVTANAVVVDNDELDAIGAAELTGLVGTAVQLQLSTASGEKNREQGDNLLAGEAIISDVQITAQNRQRTTYQVTFTGKKNMLIDLRYIVTADNHYIRTSDGHIVMAAHEEVTP